MSGTDALRFRSSRLISLWTLAAVGLLALIDSGREFLLLDANLPADRRWVLLYHNFAWWVPWIPLVLVIARVSTRWSVLGPHRLKAGMIHFILALVLSPLHVVAVASLMSLAPVYPARWVGIPAVSIGLLRGYLLLDVMTYFAVAAVLHALEYAALLQRRAVEAAALALRTSQLERALTTATLDALRAQLNPHFLFNTLNSIAGLVRAGDRDRAVGMIALLGDLLRETLGGASDQQVQLAHELAVLDRYLAIEEMRLGDRLRVTIKVAPEQERMMVPSFLLQPLVENAIRHGIGRWASGGSISVTASVKGPQLHIVVEDEPNVPEARQGGTFAEGVGIGNTRRRLRELYGDNARLSLGFARHGGCRAEVVLPAAHRVEGAQLTVPAPQNTDPVALSYPSPLLPD